MKTSFWCNARVEGDGRVWMEQAAIVLVSSGCSFQWPWLSQRYQHCIHDFRPHINSQALPMILRQEKVLKSTPSAPTKDSMTKLVLTLLKQLGCRCPVETHSEINPAFQSVLILGAI